VGVLEVMKFCKAHSSILPSFGALALLLLAGCGGGSNTNVVKVTIVPHSQTVIVSESITLTAGVTGSTDTTISSWTCQYQTASFDSTGKSTKGTAADCKSVNGAVGSIPDNSTNTTVVYTAPSQVPDAKAIAGTNCTSASQACIVNVLLTATAAADAKATDTATLSLDSGIVVSINPTTATVPLNEQEQFVATLTNDLQNKGVTWLVTQDATSTITYPAKPSCKATCGDIDATGLYKAPGTLPTTVALTVVAASVADPGRFALASVTIITGGPITFNGLSPTIAPQGASSYDLYLAAPNASSASFVTLTGATSGTTTINSASGQLKVLFPIPTSTDTAPASTGVRLRLNVGNLSVADTYTVKIFDPAACVDSSKNPIACPGGPFSFSVVPVRPTSVASIPDSVLQNPPLQNSQSLLIDGGYFGPSGSLANAVGFAGNTLVPDPTSSSSRRLNLALPSSDLNSVLPGLYPLAVTRTSPPTPSPNNPSVTSMAIFPDYSVNPPTVTSTVNPAGNNPSATDIDTSLGILAVAETGSNQVEFFTIGKNSLASLGTHSVTSPTGLSINQTNHTVAVVDYQDQSVVVFPLPGQTGDPTITYPVTISLAGLIPSNAIVGPLPMPYSIGVDSDTNNAIVAYSSNANPTTAKVGFLIDLNKNANQTCITTTGGSPCVHAQVTLNTGAFPQIAMLPHSHTAYVTPGGAGVVSGVDVTKPSFSTPISSVSLTSGLVTVITSSAHNLTPGSPTTVLISGVTDTDFDGVFTVQSVINSTSFTYALNLSTNKQSTGGTVFYGSPNVTVSLSQTSRGIAINPITRTAAIADANATNAAQINLLNSLDQSVSTISFQADCTAFTTSCAGAPEFLGTTSVAFQPYTNLLVSHNPNPALSANQKDQVSISNPVTLQRYAFVSDASGDATHLGGTGSASISVGSNTLNLFGGLAVDPATNQAFVVQSGSNTIRIVDLGGLKAAQITELQVPTVSGAQIGGISGALMPQGTLTSSTALQHVKIYGSGFDASTKARLDGTAVPTVFVSSRILDITIPATPFLAMPHRFAVDVLTGANVQSNATDFFVIKAVDLTGACSGGNPQPGSVAIADQLPGQGFAPIAVVTNTGCNNVSVVDINPGSATFGQPVGNPIDTGTGPQGIAVSPRFGLAVVANNTSGTASILDLATRTQKVGAVTVGTTPTGVAVNEGTGAALVANTGSNTISEINLALLFPTSGTAPTSLSATTISVDTSPIAIAIDPDRGTNSRGLAVVTALRLISGSSPIGVLDAIDIGGATPAKSTTASTGSVSAAPTGIVFDPSVTPALFYANSSGANTVTSYNPDTGGTSSVKVGINPTSLAINPQTGGIMTINSTSQTVSIVDTLSNPFKTRRTFGLGGSAQFGIAIDQFTNMAVIADQAHNRLLIFPMPN